MERRLSNKLSACWKLRLNLFFFFLYLKEKLFEIKKRGKFKQGLGKKNKTVLSLVYA
jgi:hypothetical protein